MGTCGLFPFPTAIHCYMRICGLFSFSTAIHCYIGSLWLILLFFNSHSLLYGSLLFSLEQPLIVIQDHCGLFSFRTATHCYMGSLWLILLQNSHSLLYAKLWLILLFNSHSLFCGLFSFRIIVAYFRFQLILLQNSHSLLYGIVAYFPFQQPFIVIQDHCGLFSLFSTARTVIVIQDHCGLSTATCGLFLFNSHSLLYGIIVAYSPFQQPLIVIQDNCGLFSFRTATHCYMGSLWLILLQNSHSLLYAKLWLILLFNSHSLLYRIIVAYFPLEQPLIVIWDNCGLFSFRTAIHCYMRIVPYSPFQQPFIVIQDNCGLFSFRTAIHCYIG